MLVETPSPGSAVRRPLVAAALVVFACFGVAGTWAALAPLDGAAIAPARVTASGNRKAVQHREGGVVSALHVEEGARVSRGQLLVELEDTEARATLQQLDVRLVDLRTREARLVSELAGEDSPLVFPEAIRAREDEAAVRSSIVGERAILGARREYARVQQRILGQRVAQLGEEIEGLSARLAAESDQLSLVTEEYEAVATLFERGMVDKPRLLAVQRAQAELAGSRGELLAQIAVAKQRIGETELEMLDIRNQVVNEVTEQLKETRASLTDLTHRRGTAEYALAATRITAPEAGVVVGLTAHTVGGVITPGQVILEIVPEADELEFEALVSPNDIDVVRQGLPARVVLTAYSRRDAPMLDGTVARVSADSFTDPRSGQSHFVARVRLGPDELAKAPGIDLHPGMSAEVYIVTERRTLLGYLLEPILRSMPRAFREQ